VQFLGPGEDQVLVCDMADLYDGQQMRPERLEAWQALVAYLAGYSADLEERSLRAVGGLLLAVRFALEVAIAGGQFGWSSRARACWPPAPPLPTPLLSRPAPGQGRRRAPFR
jgi:hypothetical protein